MLPITNSKSGYWLSTLMIEAYKVFSSWGYFFFLFCWKLVRDEWPSHNPKFTTWSILNFDLLNIFLLNQLYSGCWYTYFMYVETKETLLNNTNSEQINQNKGKCSFFYTISVHNKNKLWIVAEFLWGASHSVSTCILISVIVWETIFP